MQIIFLKNIAYKFLGRNPIVREYLGEKLISNYRSQK